MSDYQWNSRWNPVLSLLPGFPASTIFPTFKTISCPSSVLYLPHIQPRDSLSPLFPPGCCFSSPPTTPSSTSHAANARKCHFNFLHCARVLKSLALTWVYMCVSVCVSLSKACQGNGPCVHRLIVL